MPKPPLKIRRLAQLVRLLALLGLAGALLIPLTLWSSEDWLSSVAREHWGLGRVGFHTDTQARIWGFVSSTPAVGCAIWSLWQLFALFGCYARGEVFSLPAVRHLQGMARGLLSLALLNPLCQTGAVLALTWANPPGQRQLFLGWSTQDFLALLSGLVLLAVARVMHEAARMARENAEFV